MDPEEIAGRVNNLKLFATAVEVPLIIPATLTTLGQTKLETCLVGKVFSSKTINRETFRIQMRRILQVKKQ